MSAKSEVDKKPLWESIDEKEIEEGKREEIESIGVQKKYLQEYRQKRDRESEYSDRVPAMKAHFATLAILQADHIDMLERALDIAESFVDLYKRIGTALETLEKEIQEISLKTGVDLTQIKSEMAQVRETVNAPMYSYINEQKDADEKIRKSGETAVDNFTRSH